MNSERDLSAAMRIEMVEKQIMSRGISDAAVLDAMRKIPRHLFVPENVRNRSYEDSPLPIGCGQTISQPYIVALMTELCSLKGAEKVLEIGTGSGYQSAVLASLCRELFTIERIRPLHLGAKNILSETGFNNIHFRAGDGYEGWKEEAPFDRIILTACPEKIPDELILQLKEDGILIAPEGREIQKLISIRRNGNSIEKEMITYVRFVEMIRTKHDEPG